MNIEKNNEIDEMKKILIFLDLILWLKIKNNTSYREYGLNETIISDFYSFFLTNIVYFSNEHEHEKLNYLISIYNILLYLLDDEFDYTIKTKIDYVLGWSHAPAEKLPILDFSAGKELKEFLRINDEYFSFEQKQIYDSLKRNELNFVEAPTSFGKSFLIRKFVANEPGDFLIIVPTNALINEYVNELKNDIRKIDCKKELITLYNNKIDLSKSNKSKIYVMTFEKAMLFKDDSIEKINKIIIDEAHESIVAPFSNRTFVENNFLRRVNNPGKLIFFSPFIKEKNKLTQFLTISYTNQFFYDFKNLDGENVQIRNLLPNAVEEKIGKISFYDYISKEKNLIFSSKSNISATFDNFKSNTPPPGSNYKKDFYFNVLNEYIDDQLIPEQYLRYYDLKRALDNGFLLHHGDMNRTLRRMIENAFKESDYFKYIVTSSTLGKGVNLKANNLFMYTFRTDGNGKSLISFKNIIGRVGRMSNLEKNNFRFGKVFFINNNDKEKSEIIRLEKFLNSSPEKKDELIRKEVKDKTNNKIKVINNNLNELELKENNKNDYALLYKDYFFRTDSDDKYDKLKIDLLKNKIDPNNDFDKEKKLYIKEDMLIPNIKVSDINLNIDKNKEKLKYLLENISTEWDELIDQMESIYNFSSYWENKHNGLYLFKYSLRSYLFSFSPKKILIDNEKSIQSNIDYSKNNPHNEGRNTEYHVNYAINNVLVSNEKRMIFLQPFFENMIVKLGVDSSFDSINDLTDFEDIIYQQTSIDEREIVKKIADVLKINCQEIMNDHHKVLEIIKKWEKNQDSEKRKYYRYVKASIVDL